MELLRHTFCPRHHADEVGDAFLISASYSRARQDSELQVSRARRSNPETGLFGNGWPLLSERGEFCSPSCLWLVVMSRHTLLFNDRPGEDAQVCGGAWTAPEMQEVIMGPANLQCQTPESASRGRS